MHVPYINIKLSIHNELLVLNYLVFDTHLFLLSALTPGFNCQAQSWFFLLMSP